MSRTRSRTASQPTVRRRSRRGVVIGIAVAVAAVGALVAIEASTSGYASNAANSGFHTSRTETVAGITVEGADITMGAVPLDVTVTPTWTITNTSDQQVALGEPHATIVEGCCPGPLTVADPELAPGESTTLTFPLQMHEGMDGPHDFDVHVPLGGGTDTYLTLGVTATFGDTA